MSKENTMTDSLSVFLIGATIVLGVFALYLHLELEKARTEENEYRRLRNKELRTMFKLLEEERISGYEFRENGNGR